MNSDEPLENIEKQINKEFQSLNQEKIYQKTNEQKNNRPNTKLYFILKLIFLVLLVFLCFFLKFGTEEKEKIVKKENVIEEEFKGKNSICDEIDLIYLLKQRIDKGPIEICSGEKSKHICYQNINNHNNDIYARKNGVICTMENIILDPSKSR